MEDKQIIELYWERSDGAIPETATKYGHDCEYIANNILQDKSAAEACVRECYERLWETIPPRKPKNFKTYLYKITRHHAIYRLENKEQLLVEWKDCIPNVGGNEKQGTQDLIIEFVVEEFLKSLNSQERKLFVGRYWYFMSTKELSSLHKISEEKLTTTLLRLRQALKVALEEKNISLVGNEESLLFAMTEIEDSYLEEAKPPQVESEELKLKELQKSAEEKKLLGVMANKWFKLTGAVIAVVLLCVLVSSVLPNAKPGQPSTESEETGSSERPPDKIQVDIDYVEKPDSLITVLNGPTYSKESFDAWMFMLPWTEDTEIAAMPIYKNLAYHSPAGETVYLEEDALSRMAEDIAVKLNMTIISQRAERTNSIDKPKNQVYGVEAVTDSGSIEVLGNGNVHIQFLDGVELPELYSMSNSSTVEAANEVVAFLLKKYASVLGFDATYLTPGCYVTYDIDGNRKMNYCAVNAYVGVAGILERYFNRIDFGFNEEFGLTSISYGDERATADIVDYYPIIPVEEAKTLLQEGYCESNVGLSWLKDGISDSILAVELMYRVQSDMAYYQPYYCFYVKLEDFTNNYGCFYVPAVKESELYGMEAPSQKSIEILDLDAYEHLGDFVFNKDGIFYTLVNGKLKETNEVHVAAPDEEYGEAITEYFEDIGGEETRFYYMGEEILNLTEVMKETPHENLSAKYLDGQIVIICIDYQNGDSYAPYVTCYLYSEEEPVLTQVIASTPLYIHVSQPDGLQFNGGRYATRGNKNGMLEIVDILDGTSVETELSFADVDSVREAADDYYAIIDQTGIIHLVEKKSGQLIKKSKFALNFIPSNISYKDDLLYVDSWNWKHFVFVISEFEF